MADHSSTQRAEIAGLADDDPFAELTRIMGHDPRQASARRPEADIATDDLVLELENELLGDMPELSAEFSDEVGSPSAANDSWRDTRNDWRFEQEAPADVLQEAPVAAEPAQDLDIDLSDELDGHFAVEFEDELSAQASDGEPARHEPQGFSSEPELHDWQPQETAPVHESVQENANWLDEEIAQSLDSAALAIEEASEETAQEISEVSAEMETDDFHAADYGEAAETDAPAEMVEQEDDFAFDASDWAGLEAEFGSAVEDTAPVAEDYAPEAQDMHYEAHQVPTDDIAAEFEQDIVAGELDAAAAEDAEADIGRADDWSNAAHFDEPQTEIYGEAPIASASVSDGIAHYDENPTAEEFDTGNTPSQYLSPQAFANSVASGASREEAVSEPVAPFDLAAEFAAEFGEQPAPVQEEPEIFQEAASVDGGQDDAGDFTFDTADWNFEAEEAPHYDAAVPAYAEAFAAHDERVEEPFWQAPAAPAAKIAAEQPFIDTVDVPGERIAIDEARHIPEYVSEPQAPVETAGEDLELALARAFGDPENYAASAQAEDKFLHDEYATAAMRGDEAQEPQDDFDFDSAFGGAFAQAGEADDLSTNADEDLDNPYYVADEDPWRGDDAQMEAVAGAVPAGGALAAAPALAGRRRGLMIAGAIGALAVLGVVGVFAFGGGGTEGSGTPALVRADPEPVKVKPENPGGQQVPNQENQVYRRVDGSDAAAKPAQDRLVTTAEEPVEMPVAKPETVVPKSEERLASTPETGTAPQGEDVTAMAPRRVRTMVVRPDGTLVPREEPAPAPAPTVAEAQTPSTPTQAETPPAAAASEQAVPAATAPAQPQAAASPVPTARPTPPAAQQQPTRVAAAPAQPARPVAQQPAAPAPVSQAAAADGWSVQISSQPTAESAQQSYQDMAQRYGNLLSGRGVNIVKAEVSGKGTYYRVRVPTSSKEDAINLCSQLKSAGGSCFVSK
ncbi:sporulation-like protein [Nitratireductor indicus C115]|uniref:Sporulation-like protein n=1 Tax=Nitratireductor indicus C115 TaxID=1231190 RepID=K2NT70_9HYPH|nr:SPOR domain-containing protein [Nitratireductor indicus]EKF40999.1 sporulation-like protein [Nitratireductor indicus C115]SFQ73693.1 Sporulation related domain-containing protein [Nitratireductor indicus]